MCMCLERSTPGVLCVAAICGPMTIGLGGSCANCPGGCMPGNTCTDGVCGARCMLHCCCQHFAPSTHQQPHMPMRTSLGLHVQFSSTFGVSCWLSCLPCTQNVLKQASASSMLAAMADRLPLHMCLSSALITQLFLAAAPICNPATLQPGQSCMLCPGSCVPGTACHPTQLTCRAHDPHP